MSADLVWIEGEDNPRGLCWCGCGGETPISRRNHRGGKEYKGVPARMKSGHGSGVPPEQRFAKYAQPDQSGCWIWAGHKLHGYGRILVRGRVLQAHRYSHLLFIGPIPDGYEVDHLCRVTACVNPEHLEAVTSAENLRRQREANQKGEYATACRNGHPYTPENVTINPHTGYRACRVCKERADRRPRRRKRVAAKPIIPSVGCVNGHEWTPENTYRRPNGRRDCRACIRARVAAYQARQKARSAS